MDLKQLQQEIKETNKHIPPFKLSTREEQEILARTVKLNEEVGELCNDILSVLKMQRKSKLEKFDKRNFMRSLQMLFSALSILQMQQR